MGSCSRAWFLPRFPAFFPTTFFRASVCCFFLVLLRPLSSIALRVLLLCTSCFLPRVHAATKALWTILPLIHVRQAAVVLDLRHDGFPTQFSFTFPAYLLLVHGKLWARSLITPNFWYLGSRFKGSIIQSVDVLFVFNPQRNCCKSSGTLKVITEFRRLGSWLSLSRSFSCLRAGDKQDLAVWRVESVLQSSLPLEKDVTYSRRWFLPSSHHINLFALYRCAVLCCAFCCELERNT